ncbi:hypothetical protein INT44_002475 [Umbelopsis vinacea]|uniref:Uncharacterized protein n=1 Tax=Umbelopsis vinacea TaxID=44442 RepID=A0A8H7Q3Y6_9FUNG|nr:hypothetical protein INT44_002475 [Umbelopsis vinacea]
MTTTEPQVDHHHIDHPSVKGAVTHYTDGADESSHEYLSMFARAFEKGGDTQSKTTVSIDRISAAAACEAWYSYERHASLEKFDDDKQRSLDYMVGFAMAGK